MKNKKTKYIFITGGVISGVGKGIMSASIGAILKAKGYKVSIQKCDPYFNVDAGLLNPVEHGECFVSRDGTEADLDLGHYERFLDIETTDSSNTPSGKLMLRLITDERAGKFGGKTVQLVPHLTELVQDTFEENTRGYQSDIHLVEIGGTVGDMEGTYFIEAIREFASRVGRENCFYVHVVFVPYLHTSHEYKTKPAQNALRDLREFGIIPDMVAARTEFVNGGSDEIAGKIARFSGVKPEGVVLMPNVDSVYEVPLNAVKGGAFKTLDDFLDDDKKPDMSIWEDLIQKIKKKPSKRVRVGLVAKYVGNTDTYISVVEALKAAAWAENIALEIKWINAEKATPKDFASVDGLLVPGGFGTRGLPGKIAAADYALVHDKPYLGLCLGLQMACIAAARRGGLERANTEEVDSNSPENVVYIMQDQKGKEQTGHTMRLGDYPAKLIKGSKTAEVYGIENVIERHRHRYEVNQKFLPEIEKGGVVVSGLSPNGKLVEFVEAPKNKFFIATQAHPEFRSRPYKPHPLFLAFLKSLK